MAEDEFESVVAGDKVLTESELALVDEAASDEERVDESVTRDERIHRRLAALMRLLVDDGHMTPVGVHLMTSVLVVELGPLKELE